MFKIVITVDGDQFEPRRGKDLRISGVLPFHPTENIEIVPASKDIDDILSFGIKLYDIRWVMLRGTEGYFYTRATLEGDTTAELVDLAFTAHGWVVEDGQNT